VAWVRLSAVSAWIAVRVVAVVRLITFRFPGAGLVATDDGASWWPGPMPLSLLVACGHQKSPG
jgi:hypothetical protein